MKLWRLRKVWLVTATMGLAACVPQTGQDTASSSTSMTAASTRVVGPPASTLPDLPLPGTSGRAGGYQAGEYGWTGALGSIAGMHAVVSDGSGFRQTQLVFAVANDCFRVGGDEVLVTVAGLDGLYVEPYDDSSVGFMSPRGGETRGAYALPIGDRTLCVYLTWDPATTEGELAAGRQILESLRGQPYGEDGIRITFTLPTGWDTG